MAAGTVPVCARDMTRSKEFAELIRQFGPSLGRIAAAHEANPALREELMQEILLAVWRALPGFRSQCPLRNYVFRIAHNRAVSHIASHAGRPDTTRFNDEIHPGLVSTMNNPEQQLSRSQRGEMLLSALRSLTAAQRQLVMLSMDGFSYDEISEISGFSKTNVGARLSRAREALKNRMSTGMMNETKHDE
jgi:RNA polymerase sigma-70 factor (ECF subfamily)